MFRISVDWKISFLILDAMHVAGIDDDDETAFSDVSDVTALFKACLGEGINHDDETEPSDVFDAKAVFEAARPSAS